MAKKAAKELGIEARIDKISEIREMILHKYGINYNSLQICQAQLGK